MLESIDGETFLEWVAFLGIDPEEMTKRKQSPEEFQKAIARQYEHYR